MDIQIGRNRTARRAYGIDEIALVPGRSTLDPQLTDTYWELGGITREVPILASAMDSVMDVQTAVSLTALGAIGVLNLQGVQTRYSDPDAILEHIASVSRDEYVSLMQKLYQAPIQPELVQERIRSIKQQGGIAAVSSTPQDAVYLGKLAAASGADLFFVQATVISTAHLAPQGMTSLDLARFIEELPIPVIVGNCVTYDVALDLMKAGAKGLLVGIGPGAACTSRGVLGIGIPQVTAVADCAAARDDYQDQTGRYVPVVADGGIVTGGDLCKSIASGADAVMIGSPLARAEGAPGRGFHWGMATPSPLLPRGTRIKVGTTGTLEEIVRGPARLDDGTHNLLGALKTAMSTLGAKDLKQMQQVEIVIAPSLLTEGKVYQKAQQLGMGKS
ncbi:GuaB3 family IMP dehydrogenase-related protein [Anthocerotibacter panamensis]|uniref:GuaB3 family IMP dehydrogenase-related protein n=1 Tax=Anthocerotibacter panamensis TaxID=2857077 RepID=UPI001C40460F|nr:GuaB3 family IMP dehydrogenase-related protein [Anthocerotibacter panamensis]